MYYADEISVEIAERLLKLAVEQHEQLINLLTQILIEVRNK